MTTKTQLVGFDIFSKDEIKMINKFTETFVNKYNRIFGENSLLTFRLKIDKVRKRDKHTIYEIKGDLETTKGSFFASAENRKILDAVNEVIEKLDAMLRKKKEMTENKP